MNPMIVTMREKVERFERVLPGNEHVEGLKVLVRSMEEANRVTYGDIQTFNDLVKRISHGA